MPDSIGLPDEHQLFDMDGAGPAELSPAFSGHGRGIPRLLPVRIGYTGPLTIEREIPQEPARQKTEIGHALGLLRELKAKLGVA